MIWLTWRQYRIEILILILFVLLIASVLLVTGTSILSFAHQVGNINCSDQHCLDAQNKLQIYIQAKAFGSTAFYTVFQYTLLVFPLLIGLFVGIQVVARELEQGTYRLIWTQSIPWSRWLLIKISVLFFLVVGVASILYCFLLWWKIPVVSIFNNLWGYENFDIWSVPAIAYTLFALALGICTGTILRKTVPAMAVTLVIFVTVRIIIEIFWRPYFLPPSTLMIPLTGSQNLPAHIMLIGSMTTVDRQGKVVDIYNSVCTVPSGSLKNNTSEANVQLNVALSLMKSTFPTRLAHMLSAPPVSPQQQAQQQAYEKCVAEHGFQDKYLYQPADRFWLFQGIESGIYILMAALLLVLTFWWTKYRIIK